MNSSEKSLSSWLQGWKDLFKPEDKEELQKIIQQQVRSVLGEELEKYEAPNGYSDYVDYVAFVVTDILEKRQVASSEKKQKLDPAFKAVYEQIGPKLRTIVSETKEAQRLESDKNGPPSLREAIKGSIAKRFTLPVVPDLTKPELEL